MNTQSQIYKIRHSMAHVLAQAVKQEYPRVKLGFGPPIEHGFYYDFDFADQSFGEENLKAIEKRMKKIIKSSQKTPFEYCSYDLNQALKICDDIHEPYKKEYVSLLHQRGETSFSFYTHGNFVDLCDGPHVHTLKELPVDGFHLHKTSGAYWLGDEKNPMFTRIYAYCFETKAQLEQHLNRIRNAQKYDHRKLGRELELFYFDQRVGKGLPLWLPAGMAIRKEIERYAEEVEFEYGYERVHTPSIASQQLYRTSGHLPMYEDSMYPPILCNHNEQQDHQTSQNAEHDHTETYYLRPMNCPHHHLIYSHKKRSYRDLPIRLAEYGEVFRFEQSGELSGLIRVRSMCQNDGHIYCSKEQVEEEVRSILKMYQRFYDTFQLSLGQYSMRLSLRSQDDSDHQKYQGSREQWNMAEDILRRILKNQEIPFQEASGEAAFYGPKIDVQFRNLMGREETVSTIQIDFLAAENFQLSFTNADGEEESCVVIHRAPLSTHERFLSYLIEYYGGAFPTWCAPIQVAIIPIHEGIHEYAQDIASTLKKKHIRTKLVFSKESFSKKIRNCMTQKIPINLVLGNQEKEQNHITMRRWSETNNQTMKRSEFIHLITHEISSREFVQRQRLNPSF